MTHLNIQQGLNIEVVSTSIIKKLYDAAQSVPLPEEGEQNLASMSGNLQVDKSYRSLVEYLTTRFPDLYINVTTDYYVEFEDPVAKNYCALLYGDGVGMTRTALAAVTSNNDMWSSSYNTLKQMPSDLKSQVTTLNDFLYFTGTGNTENASLVVSGFNNATSIKFPPCTFVDNSSYTKTLITNCKNIQTINYSNSTFVCTNATGRFDIINANDVILDWDSSLLPNQTSFARILLFNNWNKLQKIIFPEGITATSETFNGMRSLQYAEFPSTITEMGSANSLGRDGRNVPCVVVKAVTPPTWGGYNPNDTGGSGTGFGWCKLPLAIYVPDNSVTAYKSITSGGTNNESAWASPDIQAVIKPMSEMPQLYRDMGTVTQADIDRI